jgi:hypothetical protein
MFTVKGWLTDCTDVRQYPGGRGCQILQPDYDIRSSKPIMKRRISIKLL